MKIPTLHAWNLSPIDAIALQKKLAQQIDVSTPLKKCDMIAGADWETPDEAGSVA